MNKYRIRKEIIVPSELYKYILEKETRKGWEYVDFTYDFEGYEKDAIDTLKEFLERRTRNDIVEIFER